MPSTTSGDYHKVEDIPFPDVPPAVLEKETIEEQIAEMRVWFQAWAEQRVGLRDYRPYFKVPLQYKLLNHGFQGSML